MDPNEASDGVPQASDSATGRADDAANEAVKSSEHLPPIIDQPDQEDEQTERPDERQKEKQQDASSRPDERETEESKQKDARPDESEEPEDPFGNTRVESQEQDDPFDDPRVESASPKTVPADDANAQWSGVGQTNVQLDPFGQTNVQSDAFNQATVQSDAFDQATVQSDPFDQANVQSVPFCQANFKSSNFSQTNLDEVFDVRYPAFREDKQTQLDPNELTSKLTNLKIDELYDSMMRAEQAATAATEASATGHLPDVISDAVSSTAPKGGQPADAKSMEEEIPSYQVKWIKFRGKQCAIIMQNVNGCCPLLAIMNVLLLRGKIQLPLSTKLVTYDQVIVFLANFILENGTNSAPEGLQLDYEQNINDAMQLFPKLQTGLDVNVQFNAVTSFEYTSEMIIFDLLGISLYHGWIVDRDDLETSTVIGSCSYNQLVDKIITNKSSNRSEEVSEALIAERFLESTASQLTYYGLSELVSNVREQELSILFRNNHFITLYKNQNQLYQLVTDQGFMHEPDVVWMTLSHIDNDDTFLNSDFKPSSVTKSNTLSPTEQKKQIDQDYLIALSIEEEEKKQAAANAQVAEPFQEFDEAMFALRDEELARQLQEEEDRREVQEYERNRATELENRRMNRQAKRELDGRSVSYERNYNERYPSQYQQPYYPTQNPAPSRASPPNRHTLNRTESSDSRANAEYSRNKPSNLHPNLNSTTPTENHTQSSSSGRNAHRNNHHHSSNHGHHKKNNCVIS